MNLYRKKSAFIVAHIIVVFYVGVLFLQKAVFHHDREFYPFFSWSLFSSPIPDKNYFIKSYIKIKSIDGKQLNKYEGVYTVGTSSIRLEKKLITLYYNG